MALTAASGRRISGWLLRMTSETSDVWAVAQVPLIRKQVCSWRQFLMRALIRYFPTLHGALSRRKDPTPLVYGLGNRR